MKKKKKISIQDIADKLGISKGTVSLVLSGKAEGNRISYDMCKKVKETAEEMNYQPNEIDFPHTRTGKEIRLHGDYDKHK